MTTWPPDQRTRSTNLSHEKASKPSRQPENLGQPWSRRRVLRGIQIFIGLTLTALLILFLRGRLGTSFSAIAHMSLPVVFLCVLQGLADLLMGGLRIRVLVQAFGAAVPLRMAIVANGGNLFLGGLTPSQTGGGPAQLYALMRAGVRARVAIIASLVSWLGTILFFLLAGLGILLWQPVMDLHGGYRFFSGATILVFSSIIALFLFAIPKPTLYRGRLRASLRFVPLWGAKWAQSRRIRQLEIGLALYARLMRVAIRQHPWRLAAGLLLSIGIYLNKFLVAYFILHGLGFPAPLSQVLVLQELQYLVVYFAPTPGASGIAELSAAQIMQSVVPTDHFGSYVILWRTFTLYLPMTLGGIFFTRSILGGSRKSTVHTPVT